MNLQHAKNNPGKFHEMRATATKFDVKDGDYGQYALGTLKDEMGTMEKVLFAAKKDEALVDACCARELGIWGVRYDANTDKFKAYYNGTVAKQLQGSQGSPTSPQNEPESPNSLQAGNNDIEIRKCIVCAYIASGSEPLDETVEYWTKYIKTGIDASLPENRPMENQPEDRRPVQDDDVPW